MFSVGCKYSSMLWLPLITMSQLQYPTHIIKTIAKNIPYNISVDHFLCAIFSVDFLHLGALDFLDLGVPPEWPLWAGLSNAIERLAVAGAVTTITQLRVIGWSGPEIVTLTIFAITNQISFLYSNKVIATISCTCHDSTAVVVCAKFVVIWWPVIELQEYEFVIEFEFW